MVNTSKKTKAAETNHTHFGFDADPETGKIIGPGCNPSEVKFEGNPAGPVYVHCKNGQPLEHITDSDTAENGHFVRFGGTAEECDRYISR